MTFTEAVVTVGGADQDFEDFGIAGSRGQALE